MLDFRTDTFLTVCETMNFTEAARQLHITQPAVSQHIHYLEKRYDAKLFVYENKQLGLTKAGETLRRRLMTMKNDEKVIFQEIKENQSEVESLSMGVTMTIGEYAVVHKIAGFLKCYPNINLHLRYGNTEQLLTMLNNGQIDCALVEGNYRRDGYEHLKFGTEEYIGVCFAEHQFSNGCPEKMGDLLSERLLIREQGSGTRNILEENLVARGLSIADFVHYTEIGNMHMMIELLKRDCGISFMYKVAVAEELRKGILKEIRLSDFKMQHDFDFIWQKGSIYTERYAHVCKELLRL